MVNSIIFKMSKMEVQMVTTEMSGIKDNMWKLTGRVQLMEKFIQKQFGDIFWEFVQEHADSTSDYDLPRSPTPPLAPAVTVTLIQSSSASGGGGGAASITSSNSESSSSNNSNASSTTGERGGPPPPPPLIPASNLAAIASVISSGGSGGSNSHTGGNNGGRSVPRFLPKSLSNTSKSKPVLKAASLSVASSIESPHSHHNNNHHSAPRIISTQSLSPISSEDRKPVIKQIRGGESILKSSLKASPVPTTSSTNRVKSTASLRAGCTPPTKPLLLKRAAPIDFSRVVDEDDEQEEKRMMIENLIGYNMSNSNTSGRSVNIIRSSNGIKAETDGYSAAHNGFLREMRPNPCHTRCQNRCHDIWTEQDRMDVFQLYWSIPTEEERRQWVAERIERVDMATKKTEYSNFRTCTFKYYFPHPENPRVQVCKNFFLATIDEKRSYVEKIAQEVKGISEHYSIQDIPFRRKNQMKGGGGPNGNGNGSYNLGHHQQYDGYEMVGWMTGNMDDQEEQDEDEYVGDGEEEEEVDGMEMDEMMA